jgi:hypothetical protein
MNSRRRRAIEEFKRILKWIVVIAVDGHGRVGLPS